MDHSEFYKKVRTALKQNYSAVDSSILEQVNLENLISPHKVKISRSLIDEAIATVKSLFQLSRQSDYQSAVAKELDPMDQEILQLKSKNLSLLMGYDFHISNGKLKLIEVNTNSAGYLFTDLAYRVHNTPMPWIQEPPLEVLKESFLKDMRSFHNKLSNHIYIVDENIREQKMLVEFHLYKELFQQWDFQSKILDVTDIESKNNTLIDPEGLPIEFIYNRYCDFLLRTEESKTLRQAYLHQTTCFSPQPQEYLLLADKNRLVNLSKPEWLNQLKIETNDRALIDSAIVPSYHIQSFEDPDELWHKRKNLFFKPKRSFGGKSTYRGKSITKKVFQRLLSEDTLVQELVPPPSITADGNEWKFDLRLYAYGDQVQQIVARLYQGQVTNFNSPYGGFAVIELD